MQLSYIDNMYERKSDFLLKDRLSHDKGRNTGKVEMLMILHMDEFRLNLKMQKRV